jgi:hypothetical protein
MFDYYNKKKITVDQIFATGYFKVSNVYTVEYRIQFRIQRIPDP